MAQLQTILGGSAPSNAKLGPNAAIAQLSDGTTLFTTTTGDGISTTGTTTLWYVTGARTAAPVSIGTFTTLDGKLGLGLAVDAADNIYVVGFATSGSVIWTYAFAKGAGLTWTAKTGHNITSAFGTTNGNIMSMVWCNTGGGTGNAGHLVIAYAGGSPANNAQMVLDAGVVLAGTATPTAIAQTSNLYGAATTSYVSMDLAQDGFGAASGLAMYLLGGGSTGNFSLRSWTLSSAGVLSVVIINDSLSPSGFTAQQANNQRLRIVRVGSGAYILCQGQASGQYVLGYVAAGAFQGTTAVYSNMASGLPTDIDFAADPAVPNGLIVMSVATITGATTSPSVIARFLLGYSGGYFIGLTSTLPVAGNGAANGSAYGITDDTLTAYALGGSASGSVGNDGGSLAMVKQPRSGSVDYLFDLYTAASTSAVGIDRVMLPPNGPAQNTPASNTVLLASAANTFTWTANPEAPSEAVSAHDFRYSADGGTTWTLINVPGATGTYTIPANTLAGGTNYVWQARSYGRTPASRIGYWSVSRSFVVTTAPSAPTLTTPANASYQDTSGGSIAFAATYNSTDGQNANAYALRVKVSGGAYSYWNAGTNALQGTIVWNPVTVAPGGTISATLTAAAVPDGSTYNYSFAAQEAGSNLQGAFASDFTFTAEAGPQLTVTAPTGAQVTQTPPVTWTSVLPSGAVQTAYRVVIESGLYGSVPGSGVSQYDTGVVSSAATSVTSPPLLNQTTFRAFVQITETGGLTSAWVFTTFSISLDVPSPPVVTGAAFDGTLQRILVSVQGTDNLLSANAASIETDATAWTAGANTTLARSTAQAADGLASLSLTATAAGAVSASTATGTAGIPVTVGQQVTGLFSARAATTGQTVTVGLGWYTAAGALISTSAASGADANTAFGQISVTATAPATAAFVALTVSLTASAAGEVHYIDAAGIMPGSLTAWSRGGLAGNGTAVLQRSNDGGVTWATVRNAGALALPLPTQSASIYDNDAPPNLTVQYRAMTQDVV